MMQLTQNVCCVLSIEAGEDLTQFTLVGLDGKQCLEGKPAFGVAEVDADEGEMATINVLGVMVVTAGGAVAVGDTLQSDDNGCAVKQGAAVGGVLPSAVGMALGAAAAAGEPIRMLRGA